MKYFVLSLAAALLGFLAPSALGQGQTLLSEDFENGAPGWTFDNGGTGLWRIADSSECGNSSKMAAYNLSATCTYHTGLGSTGILISPPVVLSGQLPLTVTFSYRRETDASDSTCFKIRDVGGGWNLLKCVSWDNTGTLQTISFNLDSWNGHNVEFGFDFVADGSGNNKLGWEIDDFLVTNSGPPVLPGIALCFGDGSGAACPCNNNGTPNSGGGCANGAPMPAGQGAVLSASGSNSVGADDLVLTADFTTNQPGLFFQGNNSINGGNGIAFGDGLRCCGQNVVRLEIADPPGTNGPKTISTTAAILGTTPAGTTTPGDTRCYQWWYRNPGCSLCGNNFNLSNAVSVGWTP